MKEKIFFYKNKFFRKQTYAQYVSAVKNESLSSLELSHLNFKRRKEIVRFAYANSNFYRNHYDGNDFHPSELISLTDWDKVPVVTKDDLRDNYKEVLIPSAINHSRTTSTGGSTGIPLKLLHDVRFSYEVIGWRMLKWWGTSFGADFANIYRSKPRSFLNKLIWFPTKKLNLDASSMSEEDMHIFIEKIQKIKPEIIQGYVGAIEQLAIYILDNHLDIPSPKVCWTTSSPLTLIQRNTLEKAFKCKVLDQYGCCEVFWLAQECPQQEGLHVNSDFRDITVIDGDGKSINSTGNQGRFAITDFTNKVFPIIKYLNGDQGSYKNESCSCGKPFPLINPVKGRVTDCIYLPDKTVIGGDYLTTIFDDYPEIIKGFQVIQKENGDIEVKYISNNIMDMTSVISDIQKTLISKVKNQIKVTFIEVNKIPHDAGKNRYVINKMKN